MFPFISALSNLCLNLPSNLVRINRKEDTSGAKCINACEWMVLHHPLLACEMSMPLKENLVETKISQEWVNSILQKHYQINRVYKSKVHTRHTKSERSQKVFKVVKKSTAVTDVVPGPLYC